MAKKILNYTAEEINEKLSKIGNGVVQVLNLLDYKNGQTIVLTQPTELYWQGMSAVHHRDVYIKDEDCYYRFDCYMHGQGKSDDIAQGYVYSIIKCSSAGLDIGVWLGAVHDNWMHGGWELINTSGQLITNIDGKDLAWWKAQVQKAFGEDVAEKLSDLAPKVDRLERNQVTISEIEQVMQNLPDGSAVSAQVALNSGKIGELGSDIRALDKSLYGVKNYEPNRRIWNNNVSILNGCLYAEVDLKEPLKSGDNIVWNYGDGIQPSYVISLEFISKDGTRIDFWSCAGGNNGTRTGKYTYQDAYKLKFSAEYKDGFVPFVSINGVVIWERTEYGSLISIKSLDKIPELESALEEKELSFSFSAKAYNDTILPFVVKKGYILYDTGDFDGVLMFDKSPFSTPYTTVRQSDIPYTFTEDCDLVRPNKDVVQLKLSFKDPSNVPTRFKSIEDNLRTLNKDVAEIKTEIGISSTSPYLRHVGNMQDGDVFTLEKNSIKTYKTLAFSARVASFGSLLLGHGMQREKLYSSSWLEIDNTNVKVSTYYTDTQINEATFAHGLTITNNIQVRMKVDIGKLSLRIVSNGEVFEKNDIGWDGCNGTIFAQSNGSVLNEATLSWTTKKYDAKIWMYGDSYFGLTSTARWLYYLVNDQYKDILINGFAGANASNAINDFKNEIQRGTPKYVFWCMGMNNSDSSTAVNQTWLNTYNNLKSICEASGITLVLSTIPTVRGGSVDDTDLSSFRIHKFKNEIIRNSGLRYVDVDKAVGASETTGEWYEGMLSSDGVHPTQKGAITIYQQILADFPEIATAENY